MPERQPPYAGEGLDRATLALSFAAALIFLYLRTFRLPATPFVGIGDQILFFARAARMVHGQVLYRDFFELVPPGTDLIYAAAFRLFGIHAWVMQAWAIALGLALCWVITWVAGRILRGTLVLLPALLFLVFDFSSGLDLTHHWHSTLFALAAVGVLMDGVSLQRIVAAGALCAIATQFTQTQGGLTFLALAVYLLWRKRGETQEPSILKQVAALALPFALILSCVLGYFVYKAGFRTIFFDLFVFPPKFLSGEVNSPGTYLRQLPPVHTPADLVHLIPFVFIYGLVPYIYLLGLYQLWRKRDMLPVALRQNLLLLHLAGLALFLAVANGPRFFRLCTVAPPAILICVWLVSQTGPAIRCARLLLWLVAAAFALLLPFNRQTQWHATLNLPTGRTAFSDPLVLHEFQWLAQRTQPSEPFFNSPALALYLGLENPTASEFVNYDDFTRPEQVTAIIESLQRRPPHFIVMYPEPSGSSNVHDHSAPFRRYIHENYHLAQTFSLNQNGRYEELWEMGKAGE
jgi:hypothetical protein